MLAISQIYEIANSVEIPLIVEGLKDKEALKKLGFKNIFDISGKPPERVANVKFKEVAILTDFDEEGEKKAKTLEKFFNSRGIKVNSFIRNKIKALSINKIEELSFFTKFLEEDYYGKNCSIYDKVFNRSRIFMRRNSGKTRCYRSSFWPDRRLVRS